MVEWTLKTHVVAALAVTIAAGTPAAAQTSPPATATVTTVVVRLSSFAFGPDHLVLKAGVPVKLRLTNDSSGGHDFSAPAFFAASTIPPASTRPVDGAIAVPSEQTVEVTVVPRTPGHYPLTCTHFLHSFFGMKGSIDVTP